MLFTLSHIRAHTHTHTHAYTHIPTHHARTHTLTHTHNTHHAHTHTYTLCSVSFNAVRILAAQTDKMSFLYRPNGTFQGLLVF